MTMQEQMTVVISYAQEDKAICALFMKEFEKTLSPAVLTAWKTWTDENRSGAPRWREYMNAEIPHADATILLISPELLSSKKFEKTAIKDVITKAQAERFLIFPVLLRPSDLTDWDEITRQQFFKPKGVQYGAPWSSSLAYSELVEFDADGAPLPHPMRQRYMAALSKSFQQALIQYGSSSKKKKNRDAEQTENIYFQTIRPACDLTLEDIMGSGIRSRINCNFYWRRKSDELVLENLKQGRWVEIIGAALAGKSRTLLETLRKLDNTTVLIPREKFTIDEHFRLPEVETAHTLVLLDDIEQIMAVNSPLQLSALLGKLKEAGAQVAASCRRGSELRTFESLIPCSLRENFEKIFINRMSDAQMAAFKTFHAKKAADTGAVRLDERSFDGNIGSLFMNFTTISDHYAKLNKLIAQHAEIPVPSELPGQILKSMKYFYYSENTEGKCCFNSAKIKDFCERSLLGKRSQTAETKTKPQKKENASAWQQQLSRFESLHARDEFSSSDWKNALLLLSHPDYELNLIQVSGDNLCAENVYLERLIERTMRPEHLLAALRNAYRGENLIQKGFFSSIFGSTKLINLTRSADEALKLLQRLESFGVRTDIISYNSVINKADTFDQGLAILKKTQQFQVRPDEVTLNSIIYKAENCEQSLQMLGQFREYDLIPDDSTFATVLNRAEHFTQRAAYLDMLTAYGKKAEEKLFTELINGAANFDEAAAYLDKMKDQGYRPKENILGLVISRTENFAQSNVYLDKLEGFGLNPDQITFTSLINKTDSLEEALTFLGRMERLGLKANVINYTALLSKTTHFREVVDILKRMKADEVHPNKITANLLSKKVKQSPRLAMETLFTTLSPEEIFSDFNFNRLAGEAVKADASLLEFITPHIEAIGAQKDMAITFYARMMEYNNAAGAALKLLEYTKTENFEFFNIKANCLKHTDFHQSLENYRKALNATRDNLQKSIVLNNSAQLIHDHRKTELYGEAAEMCREALKIRSFQEFPYPAELLLYFTACSTPAEQLEVQIPALLAAWKIDTKLLKKTAELIEDPGKKEILSRIPVSQKATPSKASQE